MRSSNDAEFFLSSYFSVINKKFSLNLMLFHNDEILVAKIFQLFIEADFQNFRPFSASLVFVSLKASCDVEKKNSGNWLSLFLSILKMSRSVTTMLSLDLLTSGSLLFKSRQRLVLLLLLGSIPYG